jgi:hypothetical protein
MTVFPDTARARALVENGRNAQLLDSAPQQ